VCTREDDPYPGGVYAGTGPEEVASDVKTVAKVKNVAVAALTCTAVVLLGCRLTAHHSFSAEYDASQPLRLKGTVVRIDWRNPHVWFYVAVPDPAGTVVTWGIEASAPGALARRGLGRENISPGLTVIVSGYRAKNETPTARGLDLTLPDGRALSLGSADAISPGDAK
jgi:hypothetical protein